MSGKRPLHVIFGVVEAGPTTPGRIAGKRYPFIAVVDASGYEAAIARAHAILVRDGWAKVQPEQAGLTDPDRPPVDVRLRRAIENAHRTGMTILVYDDPV